MVTQATVSAHKRPQARSLHIGINMVSAAQRPHSMPRAVALRVHARHQAFHDKPRIDVARAAGGLVQDPDTALANVVVSQRLKTIVEQPPTQSPHLFTRGPAAKFLKQAPFSV